VLFDDQRALAQPKALFGPLLNGCLEGYAGNYKIIGIAHDVPNLAVRPHPLDTKRIVFKGHP
jgi:hypothetical protein